MCSVKQQPLAALPLELLLSLLLSTVKKAGETAQVRGGISTLPPDTRSSISAMASLTRASLPVDERSLRTSIKGSDHEPGATAESTRHDIHTRCPWTEV